MATKRSTCSLLDHHSFRYPSFHMPLFACSLCLNNRGFSTFAKLFRHVGLFHQNDPSFRLNCNLNPSCGSSYKTYAAYRAHVYRHHFLLLQKPSSVPDDQGSPPSSDLLDPVAQNSDPSMCADDEESNPDTESSPDASRLSNDDECEEHITLGEIQRLYIRFLVQLREEYLLPKKIISIISGNIVVLMDGLHKLAQQQSIPWPQPIRATVNTRSDERVIESSALTNVVRNISTTIEATTRSEYEFVKLCKRFMDYQAPQEILLSTSGNKAEYGYFIPIARTLSSLLRHREMLPLIAGNVNYHREAVKNDDDLMFSLRDSSFGSRIDDASLLIQLYVDDIGLTNPIGPRKDRHKMTMVYFLLEDIPDQCRSQVQSINLLAIGPTNALKVPDVSEFSLMRSFFACSKDPEKLDRFFQPIVNDINALQSDGLDINGVKVTFSFSTLSADNLAAHQIGGYQASFSSGHFCRRCHLLFTDRTVPFSSSTAVWRTSVDHDDCLRQIQVDPHHRPLFGIVGPSVIERLEGFHPTTSLPADCMHDFLEGCCPLVLLVLLKEASASRLLTYGERRLNAACLDEFFSLPLQLGYRNVRKPSSTVFSTNAIDLHPFSSNI